MNKLKLATASLLVVILAALSNPAHARFEVSEVRSDSQVIGLTLTLGCLAERLNDACQALHPGSVRYDFRTRNCVNSEGSAVRPANSSPYGWNLNYTVYDQIVRSCMNARQEIELSGEAE